MGAGASYGHYFTGTEPFFQRLKLQLCATILLGSRDRKPKVEFLNIRFDPVFPVFYKHYDDHAFGAARLLNGENGQIENVKVSFFAPRYMDKPKQCALVESMAKGEEIEIPLYALFADDVLEITEGTKINAQIITEYTYGNTELAAETSETLELFDRNAMTWDDDRKAAAFVTAKDPER